MFNFFKKDRKKEIFSPVKGTVIRLEDVDDAVFSQKMMGDGFAVDPTDGVFKSPVEGKITLLPDTLHAFGITMDNDAEILVHIGLDTVELQGEFFTALREIGDNVEVGDEIIQVDLDKLRDKVPSLKTPVIITNIDNYEIDSIHLDAPEGDPIIVFHKK